MNHIRQFQGIILGRPGSGKTVVGKWIASKLVEKYGEEKVTACYSKADLGRLLKTTEDTLVNFLFLDDLTLAKTTKKELSDYFRIRHIINKNNDRDTGLVLTVLGLHRFYGCDPSIRTNFDFLMFRSAPTNKFDRDFTKGYIGSNGVKTLEKIELDRNKDQEQYDITIMWMKGKGAGVIRTPIPDIDYLIDIGSSGDDADRPYYRASEIYRMLGRER